MTSWWLAMNRANGAKRRRFWFMAPHPVPTWNQILDWLRIGNGLKDAVMAA